MMVGAHQLLGNPVSDRTLRTISEGVMIARSNSRINDAGAHE